MRIGRITVSDRASSGVYEDLSGPEIERCLNGVFSTKDVVWERGIVADEEPLIAALLRRFADEFGCDLVLTTGGTGPSPRDVTPEATRAVIVKELPGFGELQRMRTFDIAPSSILSRATAGIRGRCLIVNLPGKPSAVAECVEAIGPALHKALDILATETCGGHR